MSKMNSKQRKILERARKRISNWMTYFSENNTNYRNDVKFCYGKGDDQWKQAEINEYDDLFKPRFTFNMIPKYVDNINGEYSLNTPDFKVRPFLDTPNDANRISLVEGMLRHITRSSRNKIIYQTAMKCALAGGYGSFRIIVTPEDTYSFNLNIEYKAIHDPTQCFWDTAAVEIDKHDGVCCGVLTKMSKDEYDNKYPGFPHPTSFEYESMTWMDDDSIVVADYYEKQYFTVEILLLNDGRTIKSEDLEQELSLNPTLEVIKTKKREDYNIYYYRMTADQILESSKWDGKILPIIFQAGRNEWIDGKEKTISFFRYMKDAQRTYNWSRSEFLYRLTLARYEPYLVCEDNIQGHEEEWRQAHKARAALVYKRSQGGERPQRVTNSNADPALLEEIQRSYLDLQNIAGRYEASVGAQGNEMSGTAIANRQRPSNLSVLPYFNNATNAIESGAKAVLDLLPRIYDTERRIILSNKDGSPKEVVLNKANELPGSELGNTLEGHFDVSVTVGASFALQQAEALDKMIKLVQVMPQFGQITPDLIAENLDVRGQERLIDRTKEYLVPKIIAAEKGEPLPPSPPNPEQLALQQQQMIEMQRAQNEKIESLANAFNKRMGGIANLMNATTNQDELKLKGIETQQKTEAEERKAAAELLEKQISIQKQLM